MAAEKAAENIEMAARQAIRRHIYEFVHRFMRPAHDASSELIGRITGPLRAGLHLNRQGTLLADALITLHSDYGNLLGKLNIATNQSLQDAAEKDKAPVTKLIEQAVNTLQKYFRLSAFVDEARLMNFVLLQPHESVSKWKHAHEALKAELVAMGHYDGLRQLGQFGGWLTPAVITATSPRVVPVKYGQGPLRSDEGIYVENHGAPARSVVVQPLFLGHRRVEFNGPEIGQLKHDDGPKFRAVSVTTSPGSIQVRLYSEFREWQQEVGNLSLETVGVISYADFHGGRYETFYRLGVDVQNSDGGMVVEFVEQRRV